MSGQQIKVIVCAGCEGKVVAARGVAKEPLAACTHLDKSVIYLPGVIEIISANTGEVLFTFDVPAKEITVTHKDQHV